jgi:REP element-mobilizing transposase RayT
MTTGIGTIEPTTQNHPADAGRSPDRYWFLTWTTYGSRLPGDDRGFVSPIRDESGIEVIHNIPNTPLDAGMSRLEEYSRRVMRGDPILLNLEQAVALWEQFQETGTIRKWQLLAVAVMANHVHIVVGVPGDPDPSDLLRDFKSYGSRRLNRTWGKPKADTWWTESGSKRKLKTRENVLAAIKYVLEQEFPLLVWTAAIPELNLVGGRIV